MDQQAWEQRRGNTHARRRRVPVVAEGDYEGVQGPEQYNASASIGSSGNLVVSYTSQSLLSDGTIPLDANGNETDQNIYVQRLSETTDIAGPHVVGWTDGNGVDLMPDVDGAEPLAGQTATATGVDAQYFVLTFDQPMLADNPAVDPDSVYNPANYQIYNATGNQLSGVITNISYGVSDVAQVAQTDGLANTVPDNKWEVVLTLDNEPGVAGNHPLPDGTYTLKVLNAVPASATTVGQPGLRNMYGEPLNLTGYNPNGSDFIATVTISATVGTTPGRRG